ncbi:T9SS type A sorting domain-containing protein [Psychroserpens sp. XS_ASV72]|uniref:T9SS type A sorting domain-containing protein n=1 Tax=Psychroserpens sp. XS_ASV72 TaxID=3241293 RepID=UPI003515FD2B
MKKNYVMKFVLMATLCFFAINTSDAQIRMVNVDPSTNVVQIHNYGGTTVDVSSYWFCHLFTYSQLSGGTVQSGSLNLAPGADVVVQASSNFNASASDLGLYSTNSFGSTAAMQDFLQWGSGGLGRENVAVAKGIWTAGTFISVTPPYEYTGDGAQNGFQFWATSLGLDDFDDLFKFSISPNPAATEMKLIVPGNFQNIATVRVFDLLGKLIVERELNGNESTNFDVSNWTSGLYLVRISTENNTETKRFVKQ